MRHNSSLFLFTGFLCLAIWLTTIMPSIFTPTPSLISPIPSYLSSVRNPVQLQIKSHIIPIKEALFTDKDWPISTAHVYHVAASARPNEQGNIIMYGHNTSALFGMLRTVRVGDRIALTTMDGVVHEYAVTTRKTVWPTNTTFLSPSTQEIVTIYTCAGLFDTKRLVVQAVPVPSFSSQAMYN